MAKNRPIHAELERSHELRRLLTQADAPEVLPWSAALRIVAQAPPARRTWLDALNPAPALHYASAAVATLIVATGVLAVVPAQSDHAGTIITAQLPASWQVGGPELAEVRSAAQADYRGAVGDAGQLYFLTTERAGRPQLTLALEHLDGEAADALFGTLVERYPALGAFPAELSPIEGARQSMLASLLERVVRPGELSGLSDNEARIRVVQALGKLGLTVTEVTSERDADGNLIIRIDAEMEIRLEGRTQEALQSAGLDREVLGEAVFEQLEEAAR